MTTPRPAKPAPKRTRGKPQTPARQIKLRKGLARFSVEMPPALVARIERAGARDMRTSRNAQIAYLCTWALDRQEEEAKKKTEVATPSP